MANSAPPPSPGPAPHRGPAFWLATWFGSGLFPKAPGTMGSLASLVVWAPLVLWGAPWWVRLGLAFAIFAVGVPVSTAAARALGKDDPKEVVIDEVAGQGVALALAAPLGLSVLLGFALFRLFDIAKPPPVGTADRHLHGGLGIMVDDMLAGGYALALLFVAERWLYPLLGDLVF